MNINNVTIFYTDGTQHKFGNVTEFVENVESLEIIKSPEVEVNVNKISSGVIETSSSSVGSLVVTVVEKQHVAGVMVKGTNVYGDVVEHYIKYSDKLSVWSDVDIYI